MKVLFLNTSNSNLVIGIVDSDKLVYRDHINVKEHSQYVISSIEKGLDSCHIKPIDIDKIMVIHGPGSFTGLRIGITIAKTYAFSLKKKVLGISSLKAIALSSDKQDYIIPIIDARSGYLFGAIYDRNYNEVMPEKYLNIDELKSEINKLNGSIGIVYNEEFLDADIVKDFNYKKIELDVLKIVNHYKNDEGINPHELNPIYLKKSQAEENCV